MYTKSSFIASLGFIGLALAAPWSSALATSDEHRDDDDDGLHCRLAGLYIGTIPGQTAFTLSAVPFGPAARNVELVIDTTGDGDPTAGGRFPTAVGQTHPRGFATKDAPNSYTGQLVRYIYDASRAVVGTEIQVVSIEQTDCNTLAIGFETLSFYFYFVNPGDTQLPTPDLDVDVSGFPAIEAKRMLPYRLNAPGL